MVHKTYDSVRSSVLTSRFGTAGGRKLNSFFYSFSFYSGSLN